MSLSTIETNQELLSLYTEYKMLRDNLLSSLQDIHDKLNLSINNLKLHVDYDIVATEVEKAEILETLNDLTILQTAITQINNDGF